MSYRENKTFCAKQEIRTEADVWGILISSNLWFPCLDPWTGPAELLVFSIEFSR